MPAPLVTVGIPSYQHAAYIRAAVESVLAQDFGDFELIISDDDSTDDTRNILRSFDDPRIRVIANPGRQGPSLNANVYLSHARGKYIAPLPSDDFFAPERLGRQVDFLERNPAFGMATSRVELVGERGEALKEGSSYAHGLFDHAPKSRRAWLRVMFDGGNRICGPSVMIRREWFDKTGLCDPRLLHLQDYDLWVRFLLGGMEIGHVEEAVTNYRILPKEMNLGAPTQAGIPRFFFERTLVLERFLAIPDRAEYTAIFGETSEGAEAGIRESVHVAHALAQRAWRIGTPAHRMFALNTWARLLEKDDVAAELARLGFTMLRFYEMSAEYPLGVAIRRDWRVAGGRLALACVPPALRPGAYRAMKNLARRRKII